MDYCDGSARPDPAALLAMLESDDPCRQREALLVACPCRNRYYEPEIWRAICRVRRSSPDGEARERANHVIGTLQDRTRFDPRAVAVLRWLDAQGEPVYFPPWLRREIEKGAASVRGLRLPKLAVRDVLPIVEALGSDDGDERRHALEALCPGPARRYPRKAWRAIFQAGIGPDSTSRRQARLALHRLLEYAVADRCAWATLAWLHGEVSGRPATDAAEMARDIACAQDRAVDQPARPLTGLREHAALRGPAEEDVDARIEGLIRDVRACDRPRPLRIALYALFETGADRARPIVAEYVDYADESVRKLARSLLRAIPNTPSSAPTGRSDDALLQSPRPDDQHHPARKTLLTGGERYGRSDRHHRSGL